MLDPSPPPPAAAPLDLLWGAPAIATVINRGVRETYHLLENGHLTAAKKVGGRWCASRQKLAEQFSA